MLELFIIISIIGVFILALFLAELMGDVAKSKGHKQSYYRNLCFWLGIPGYLVVLGLKDLNLAEQNDEIIELLGAYQGASSAKTQKSTPFDDLPSL